MLSMMHPVRAPSSATNRHAEGTFPSVSPPPDKSILTSTLAKRLISPDSRSQSPQKIFADCTGGSHRAGTRLTRPAPIPKPSRPLPGATAKVLTPRQVSPFCGHPARSTW
jgi:hypothetical protein